MSTEPKPCYRCKVLPVVDGNTVTCPKCGTTLTLRNGDAVALWNQNYASRPDRPSNKGSRERAYLEGVEAPCHHWNFEDDEWRSPHDPRWMTGD